MHANQSSTGHKPHAGQQHSLAQQNSTASLLNYSQQYSAPQHNVQPQSQLPVQYSAPAQNGHMPIAAGVPISNTAAASQHGSAFTMPYATTASQPTWPVTAQPANQGVSPQPAGFPVSAIGQQPVYSQQPQQQQQQQGLLINQSAIFPGHTQPAPVRGQVTGNVTARSPSPIPAVASTVPALAQPGRGFTANQLNVLRNQILAFRRIKVSSYRCCRLLPTSNSCISSQLSSLEWWSCQGMTASASTCLFADETKCITHTMSYAPRLSKSPTLYTSSISCHCCLHTVFMRSVGTRSCPKI